MNREPYYVQTGSSYENPYGIPHDELARMEQELPPEVVAQVIYGKFVDMSGLVFTAEIAGEMFLPGPRINRNEWITPNHAQHRIEQEAKPDFYRYAHGVDLARKKDYTVVSVLDTIPQPAQLVYFKRLNRVPWPAIYAEIGKAQYLFPGEQLVDATGSGGDVVMEELGSRLYCPRHHVTFDASAVCPHHQKGRGVNCRETWIRLDPIPYVFTNATKVQLINHLQQAMGQGHDPNDPDKPFGAIRCPRLQVLIDEITEYAWDDKKLQTDCVMSLALAAMQGIHMAVESALIESAFGA